MMALTLLVMLAVLISTSAFRLSHKPLQKKWQRCPTTVLSSVTSSPTSQSTYTSSAEKKTFRYQGIYDISYQHEGDSSAPPLLLIHGFGASSGHFRYNIPVLSKTHNVFAIDLLGFGDSSKPKDVTFSMELLRDLCADFMLEMGGSERKWVVGGNSIGGLCSINLAAATSPVHNLIRGVILFNCAGGLSSFRFSDYPVPLAVAMYFVKNVVLKVFGSAFYRNFKTRANVEQILNQQVYFDNSNVDEELVEMLLKPSDDDGAEEVFLSVFGADPGVDPKELLPSVTAPILALWGTKDSWTPLSGGSSYVPYASKTIFKLIQIEAGHCLHDEKPDQCHEHILPFLENLP